MKPESVLSLEKALEIVLKPLKEGELTDWGNQRRYEIDEAGRLVGLNLRDCRLSRVCISLQTHLLLQTLVASENPHVDWSFLKGMNQLTTLDLRGNRIRDASFLKGMNQLTKLDLGSNEIKDASFLEGMNQLTTLNLRNNQVKDASFLKGMDQLTSLDLRNNQVKDASFLKGMNQLTSLDLSYNPLITPPPEIVGQGLEAIRRWFADAEGGSGRLNEIKVILVGDGKAGKTTLRKRLMGWKPKKEEKKTDGIEIVDHKIRCGDEEVTIHFWDFGGQEIMHATHQFFLSHRSLYILVLDGRKEEDPDYWLKHIESFGGNSPILVVLSKVDENPAFEANRKELQQKYPGIQEFFRVNSLDTADPGITSLLARLPSHLSHLEIASSTWPEPWFRVKEQLRLDDKPYLEASEFANLCTAVGVVETEAQSILIRYLNDLGVALHFEDRRLNLLQILNPLWATQAVYRIINDKRVANDHGLLETRELAAILKPRNTGDFDYPTNKHNYLLDLMKKFELCYEVDEDRFLIPDLLGVEEPQFDFPARDLVRFRYEYGFLPSSVITRFMVRRHAEIDGLLRWRTGVVLKSKKTNARAVVRSDKNERKILIDVSGVHRREFFAVIRDEFDAIHGGFKKFEVAEKVPLYRDGIHVHDFDYLDLRYHEDEGIKKILVGKLRESFDVKMLLDGIEPKEERQRRRASGRGKLADVLNIHHYHEGLHMGDSYSQSVGDRNKHSNLSITKQTNNVNAESIVNSFDIDSNATNTTNEIRELLQQLVSEAKAIVAAHPERARETAAHLAEATKEATSNKPDKKSWEASANGIIETAKKAGNVGKKAIELISKLGPLIGC